MEYGDFRVAGHRPIRLRRNTRRRRSWDPAYLRRCEEAVLERGLDMAAAGIIYHKDTDHEGWPLSSPARLDVDDLLVRNPHIQGSNLFVRLRKLLEAGGFDEALASATDRDLCIRLADLCSVRYGPIRERLVHHYAEDGRPRLSTPGGDAKRAGLRYFFRKYRSRMSDAQRYAFLQRAREKFGCDADEPATLPPPTQPLPRAPRSDERLDLVVGAITSPNVGSAANLMDALVHKIGCRRDVTLKVILLENGGHDPDSRNELTSAVAEASRRGLDVDLKTLERQASDAAAGVFAATQEQLYGRKSIAMSRTMLQHYLFMEAKPRQGSVVWILDDDAALEGLAYGPDGSIRAEDIDYVSSIKRLKETGACVVLGEVTGEPPLPFLSCIRTQLVDLCHNLQQLAALRPDAPYPDRGDENRLIRLNNRDYYYDLSRNETDHLESPFWYEASAKGMTVERVFDEMVSRLPSILSGSQVFRPLAQTERTDIVSDMVSSVNRGPTTLVFDLQTLREFPNAVPAIGGSDIRRSDMVWSLLNMFVGGCRIAKSPLPIRQVRQHRGTDANSGPESAAAAADFKTLAQDIRGYALYSALHDVFLSKAEERQRQGGKPYSRNHLDFDGGEVKSAARLYAKYVRERSRAYESSFIRVAGLVSALRPFYDRGSAGDAPAWWLDSPERSASVAALRRFVESVESIHTQARLDDFKGSVSRIDTRPVERYLESLPDIVARHRSNTPLPKDALRRSAEAYVHAEFGTGPLTCLGIGEEGVVLTDGRMAYKYFHYWKGRHRKREVAFLQRLVGKLSGYSTLLDVQEVRMQGDYLVAVYPYEAGTKYSGGRLDDLLTLLRECRQAGIVCRNVHPDNLIATPSGLKLIDFGADIAPYSGREFAQMCRRAFLTYRFHFRPDLKRLMTRALAEPDLPELAGFEQFMNALDPRSWDDLFHRPFAELALARQPKSVLDYGCGSGWLAEQVSRQGIAATGYDPDTSAISRCRQYDSPVQYGGSELRHELRTGPTRFDTVVCGRVLCTIEEPSDFDAVLKDLRLLTADSGTVFVAVCNPFYLSVTSTEIAEKRLPPAYIYEDTFTYAKLVDSSSVHRTEVHRSFETYRLAFTRAGLRIDQIIELDGADTHCLLPASDHLVFRLSPVPDPGPRVSLLIKTCLMEWRTIERLVRHQVRQLDEPRRFVEKVVVVDPSHGPFLRQYDDPDPEAHRAAMDRLLNDGVVDRVVYAPEDPDTIRAAYMKWFGVESDETHSKNGQQLFATLFGFDSCNGDYALQIDGDLLIARPDASHDYLTDMVDVLRRDPNALFVSPSIRRPAPLPYTHEGPRGSWRVDVWGSLFDRHRVRSALPIANDLEDGRFAMPWHRAFDRFIASSQYRSYRGGDPRTAFIHVPNHRKTDVEGLFEIIAAVERGHAPTAQTGNLNLAGSPSDWAGPKRREPFVFVICGRNVDPGRFKRCIQSLTAQDSPDWGAVVVDDASTNGFGDYTQMLLADYTDRVTFIQNEIRRGALYNTWNAVTRFCDDPNTVILTLDADDALIGPRVLDRVRAEYDAGADATVGSMLRLDKEARYEVDFDQPRSWASNVWHPLRTFRKYLFDAINVEDLKLDGQWIDLANDWAFMVPIVEMASSPRHIPDLLYLHEPTTPNRQIARTERDSVVARILAKPPYPKLDRDPRRHHPHNSNTRSE